MGLIDRLRSEVSQLVSSSSDKTEPITFVSGLVSGQYTNKKDNKHLLYVAWEDAIANRITVGLSNNVLDDWFILRKSEMNDEEEYEEHPDNQAIQEEFIRLEAKHWLTEALIGERIFGNSALIINGGTIRLDTGDESVISSLNVATPENSTIPSDAFDALGNPTYLRYYYNAENKSLYKDIEWEDVIWWCTRPKGNSWYGYSALWPVWDDLTYLRHSKHGLGWLYQKMGLGWLLFFTRSLTAEDKSALENMLKNLSQSRSAEIDVNRCQSVEWVGPEASSTEGLVAGIDMFLSHVASGSGVPKDIFTGVSAGAITGSEINNKALYATISKIQSAIEPYIRVLIQRMGYDTDYTIEWNTRYATDELEQAQIDLLKAQAAQLQMQVENGADFSIGFKDMEQENNPTGVQAKQ